MVQRSNSPIWRKPEQWGHAVVGATSSLSFRAAANFSFLTLLFDHRPRSDSFLKDAFVFVARGKIFDLIVEQESKRHGAEVISFLMAVWCSKSPAIIQKSWVR